ncbi:hypothetical protein ETB97_008785 [Aspergillus alliaceus]|uniref:FAD linked oxidase N-terminal domain-containing protein n=1 Tax=Petromyces alliaceus TaxID=209559 RepID=A0A8H6E9X6_PETAA|nr:hypothetical protein ETB97_008785 [Aspergillus burnettii]
MNRTSNCKVFPADSAWPRLRTWDLLDQLIHWRCSHQTNSYFHNNDPIEMLSPVYQGLTCQPTANPNATCSLGGYPAYAVNVSSVDHIQLAINFARQTGVRLVVKNTGHDSSGKSGGAGALSIRTHNLKGIQYVPSYNASGADWTGAAFKIGTGIQAYEIYKAARTGN